MVTGSPSIASKMPTKSAFWNGSSLASAALRPASSDARIISRIASDAVLAEEHVLGAAQADALGAELAGLGGVGRGVGVGADLQLAALVGPAHQRGEVAGHGRGDGRHLADHHVAGRAVDGDELAGLHRLAGDGDGLARLVDLHRLAADDARLAPAAGDHGRVARLAAGAGENALREVHARHVFGAGLLADQQDRVVRVLRRGARPPPRPTGSPCPTRPRGWRRCPAPPASAFAFGSSCGSSRWFRLSGFTRFTAVVSSISFSFAISTAMRTAAVPVRLPVRVCSMYSVPSCTVNSMSCISL